MGTGDVRGLLRQPGLKLEPPPEAIERRCQVCGGARLEAGLDLGHQPIADHLLTAAELDHPETFYPLRLFHCRDCGLCQLGYVTPPEAIYRNFTFVSGTTRTAREHLGGFAAEMTRRLGLGGTSFAVDIGSSDGTLLKGYAPAGVRVLGVEAAAYPAEQAIAAGIPTWHAFFDHETAGLIRQESGAADAITAAGVFGHVADLDSVMRGIGLLLKEDGIFAADSQYWLDIVGQTHYDNIFHEHLRHYSMKPLAVLFARYGFEMIDVSRSPVYGGSFRVFAARKGRRPVEPAVAALAGEEERAGLHDPETWARFAAAARTKRDRLIARVADLRRAGQEIVGIGAPAKASTVCNYCRLGRESIAYLTEVNPLRTGKFLPGVHVPIEPEPLMFEDRRRLAGLLFAWNYYDEIVPKLRARGFAGEVICP